MLKTDEKNVLLLKFTYECEKDMSEVAVMLTKIMLNVALINGIPYYTYTL